MPPAHWPYTGPLGRDSEASWKLAVAGWAEGQGAAASPGRQVDQEAGGSSWQSAQVTSRMARGACPPSPGHCASWVLTWSPAQSWAQSRSYLNEHSLSGSHGRRKPGSAQLHGKGTLGAACCPPTFQETASSLPPRPPATRRQVRTSSRRSWEADVRREAGEPGRGEGPASGPIRLLLLGLGGPGVLTQRPLTSPCKVPRGRDDRASLWV